MKRILNCLLSIISILSVTGFIYGQRFTAANDTPETKAAEILKLAHEKIYKNIKLNQIGSLNLKTKGVIVADSIIEIEGDKEQKNIKSSQDIEENISIDLQDKTNITVLTHDSSKNPIENFSKIVMIFNGEEVSSDTVTVNNGRQLDLDMILNSPSVPESTKKQIRENQEKTKRMITRQSIQKSVLNKIFPILLNDPWKNRSDFIYIGKAQAENQKADILELKAAGEGETTRYYFDESTHLLLMVTEESVKKTMTIKTSYYFSDYQLVSGILIANRVNSETESVMAQTFESQDGKKAATTKSKLNYEMTIKEFKINPTFKADTFMIKGR